MGLLEKIGEAAGGVLKPVTELIDELHTSGEEKQAFEAQKLVLKAQLLQAEQDIKARLFEAETARLQSQHQVQIVEQQQGNWLSKAWRPIVGLAFVAQMLMIYGVPAIQGLDATVHPPEEYWFSHLAILGVAIAGRSVEKISRDRAAKSSR